MGLNAYFAYVVVLGYGLSWQQANCRICILCRFLHFSLSRARAWMILSIPAALQIAITSGIGLFLAMIGLTGAGIIVDNPDTLVGLGPLNTAETGLAVLGLIIMAGLAHRGFKSGILLTILGLASSAG